MEIILLSFGAVLIVVLIFIIRSVIKGEIKAAIILAASAILFFFFLYFTIDWFFAAMDGRVSKTTLYSPAEDSVLHHYQVRYKDARVDFFIDQFAEDKMYRYRYGHGIYNVRFTSQPNELDFRQFGEDSLAHISNGLLRRVAPVILHRSCYDSFKVTFVTSVPVQPGSIIKPGATYPFIRTFGYGIRK